MGRIQHHPCYSTGEALGSHAPCLRHLGLARASTSACEISAAADLELYGVLFRFLVN